MGNVGKRVLEGQTKQQRQAQRRELGTLRSLTVYSKTSNRYIAARTKFYNFLRENSLEIPSRREHFDSLLAEYIEHLWSEGETWPCSRYCSWNARRGSEAERTAPTDLETFKDVERQRGPEQGTPAYRDRA